MIRMRNWVFVFSLGFLTYASSAKAYIPPSQYIVKSWVNKHSGLKTMKVRSTVTGFALDKPTSVHFKAVTVYSHDGQKLKTWATDDSDRVLYSVERDHASMNALSKLLFLSDSREVARSLQSTGVPVKTESELLKLKTEVERREVEQESLVHGKNFDQYWVLGNANSKSDPESPQLWVEKDVFLPARYLFRPKNTGELSGDLYDVRFENYRFTREIPYPRSISVRKKGVGLVLSEQVMDLAVNSDSASLKRSPPVSGFTELGQAASPELKALIQNYYEVIR